MSNMISAATRQPVAVAVVKRLPLIHPAKFVFGAVTSTVRNNCLTFELPAQYAPLLTGRFIFSKR
jgi:hypothetical protein